MNLLSKSLLGLVAAVLALAIGLVLLVPGIHVSSIPMILNVMLGTSVDTSSDTLLQRLRVAEGFSLSVYARGLTNPRMLYRASDRHLLVSSPRSGKVLLLIDSDENGVADEQRDLLEGLNRPHGLEIHGRWLYVAESNQIGRIVFDPERGSVSGSYQPLITGLTDDGNHWSKTLRFDQLGWLYVAMGSSCNVCEEADTRRATIMRYRADGSDGEVYASGLRNSVGMDFAPWDDSLYATDNGRDLLGDDYPPCELNRIEEGGFYGWPHLNVDNELDPDFGAGHEALQTSALPPVFKFPAHNAPLGIHFIRSPKPGPDFQRSALVALHGSWNRSQPDGFKVVSLHWNATGAISSRDFLWGFELDGDIVGLPVDVTRDGRGCFFVSDDYAGVIYRVSYGAGPVSAALDAGDSDPPVQRPTDPGLVAAGAEIYRQLPCADCHGTTALTPVPLNRLLQRYDLDSLADYFVTPTPPMPQFDLDQQQREQLAHYLISQAGRSPAGRSPAQSPAKR
ncbi:MAG: PQQ-dependent sugar dehydrogenase [Gammaproteobacteria bacterium]|nr:PQQ-dependent sugar dehydrogenase [Gammaproteobacteria bacterium]